jgi:hypothetical protein
VRGLAYTLDRLTRELGVLFVVPTGNLRLSDLDAATRRRYPRYLSDSSCRLLDPAPALNVLTVGGLSRHEATRDSQRYPNAIEDVPIATGQLPFPLTRCGPSVNGAIKPDLVEHAGNVAVSRSGSLRSAGLGVVSTSGDFASGRAFREDIGTSYASPAIAHRAALILRELPTATPNTLRALLGASAKWPAASSSILNSADNSDGRDSLLRVVGYGLVDDTALYRSLDHTVTLLAEERIGADQNHFFEVPSSDEFWAGRRRTREISVALAYSPVVRTTRIDYRRSRLWFTLVTGPSLDAVTQAFRRNRLEGIPERGTGRWLPNEARRKGTLQVSRWEFRQALPTGQKIFVVVTRQDAAWSTERDQEEPYSLSIVLADRDRVGAKLYAEIRTILEARAQLRARARS